MARYAVTLWHISRLQPTTKCVHFQLLTYESKETNIQIV